MKQMTLIFADAIGKKEDGKDEKEVFDLIYNSLEKVCGKGRVDKITAQEYVMEFEKTYADMEITNLDISATTSLVSRTLPYLTM